MNAIPVFTPATSPVSSPADPYDANRAGVGATDFSDALDRAAYASASPDDAARPTNAPSERAESSRVESRRTERADRSKSSDPAETDLLKTDEHPVVLKETSALQAMLELATRENAATTNTHVVVKDTAALQPEMKSKVDRVIQRMKDEAGLTVNVNETWRSQSRQDALYEQGRSRPGQVVTWTQNSRHTAGLAADLVIDGANGNSEQYAMLQRIAGEEGLRTLGAKDPGHVELNLGALQNSANGTILGGELTLGTTAGVAQTATIAQVARVADVAGVAPLAQVAQVAQVATPASVAAMGAQSQGSQVLQAAQTIVTQGMDRSSNARNASSNAPARDGRRVEKRSATLGDAQASSNASRFSQADAAATLGIRETASAARVDGVLPSTVAQRLEAVMKLQDTRDQQPINQMLLRLDNGQGGEDRIRVGTMGARVGAALDLSDSTLANSIGQRSSQLVDALAARGLSMDALNVRTAGAATAPTSVADLARALSASADLSANRLAAPTQTYDSSTTRDGASGGQKHPNDQQRRRPRDPQGEQQ